MGNAAGTDPRYEEIVQRLAGAVRASRLYSACHPSVGEHVAALVNAVNQLLQSRPVVLIGFVGGEVIADDTLLLRASALRADLAHDMPALGIHRLLFERGVTREEVAALVAAIASHKPQPGTPADAHLAPEGEAADDFLVLPHLKAGHIPVDASAGSTGFGALAVRRTYSDSVESARTVWESAAVDGQPDVPGARNTVEQLADAVTTGTFTMIGLTGMQAHDDYTFTHMVNTAILAMAQTRSLGIDGERLRLLGLAAFLHDIGKVRTPIEILQKPAALTPEEFGVIRRHPIDGAQILRSTPGMPQLAAVVAFEHHMRLDGSGYPEGTRRRELNLATALCGISDVYDAMRSQRRYQRSSPTDRILEVMKRNDGRQFDQHLVRRFIHLMGIYPPASLVRLASGEVAVVLENDGPDPAKPTVRVVTDRSGARLPAPPVRCLWDSGTDDDPAAFDIACVLDPAEYALDPVAMLQ